MSMLNAPWIWMMVLSCACAYYVPGMVPVDYPDGADLEVLANKLVSPNSKLPFDYYSVPSCFPAGGTTSQERLNLGQVLLGERSQSTAYNFRMKEPAKCHLLCEVGFTEKDVRLVTKRIQESYRVRLNLDGMPLVVKYAPVVRGQPPTYSFGYPLGSDKPEVPVLYNYLKFIVRYFQTGRGARVVGFEVEPVSTNATDGCSTAAPQLVQQGKVLFFYDVKYVESDVPWATRWDHITRPAGDVLAVEWHSILRSIALGLLLTIGVAIVGFRTVRKDMRMYSELDTDESVEDVTGWRIIEGDAFRAPKQFDWYCVLHGTGAQIAAAALSLLAFALLGLLKPAHRGALLIYLVESWLLTSIVAGFCSTRLYISFQGTNKGKLAIMTWFAFPSLVFLVFIAVNTVVSINGSTGAVPFVMLVLLLFMWFGVSLPMVLLGTWLASRTKKIGIPVQPTKIERVSTAKNTVSSLIPLVSVIPFGAVYIEFNLVLQSLWHNQVFTLFGFAYSSFVLFGLICAELAIIVAYVILSSEDHHWWWRSYWSCALSGVYAFVFSVYYLVTTFSHFNTASVFIYTAYMLIVCLGLGLLAGFFASAGSLSFVRIIYKSLHND